MNEFCMKALEEGIIPPLRLELHRKADGSLADATALQKASGTAALLLTDELNRLKNQLVQVQDRAAQQTRLVKECELGLEVTAELEAYRPKLADIERQLANLKQQLEIERKIVPDEKEVDNFMRMVGAEARKAGVEIRRKTAVAQVRGAETVGPRNKRAVESAGGARREDGAPSRGVAFGDFNISAVDEEVGKRGGWGVYVTERP